MNEENIHGGENGNRLDDNESNNNSIYSNEEFIYTSKYTKITLSFIIIFLIKSFFYIYFLYNQNIDYTWKKGETMYSQNSAWYREKMERERENQILSTGTGGL